MSIPSSCFHSMLKHMVFAFLLLSATVLTAAEQTRPDSVQYDVFVREKGNEKKVGSMYFTISEQAGDSGPLLQTRMSMNLGFRVFLVVKMTTELWQEVLKNESGAYSFYRTASGAGRKAIQQGYYDGSRLCCDTKAKGETKHQEFADSLFNYTSMDCPGPEAALELGEEKTVRILYLETMKVHNNSFRYLRDENLYVGNDTIPCKVIRYESGRHKGLRWVTRDSYGIMIKNEPEVDNLLIFRPTVVFWNNRDSSCTP